jgi:glycosyltransferase involved in cell wall biosynthesis
MNHWDIITGEYPPQAGGVSDYTRSVARGLAETGDQVHVWAPPCWAPELSDHGITVHRLPDHFRWRSLGALTHGLAQQPNGSRILLQYVPHAFGWKAMNLPFCIWLFTRTSRNIWVVCHEVAVPFGWNKPLKNNLLGLVTRLMSLLTARAARRIWITIPRWKTMLTRMARPNTPIEYLPVPSTIQVSNDLQSISSVRQALSTDMPFVVGHFGTYRLENARLLLDVIPVLVSVCPCHFLLLGYGSNEFLKRLLNQHPELEGRVTASGALISNDLSAHLGACDLMVQPYPDGVSGRRTSMMACLAHGLPVITNQGSGTEEHWLTDGAASVVCGCLDSGFALTARALLADADTRRRLGFTAKRLYAEQFAMARVIRALRDAALSEEERSFHAMGCHSWGKT